MISQSDIIKILVQRQCTDESVMSIANSPNCKVTQLLEKLIEVERFDLALDISMKLGLDVTPICKTWAMRCLSARNFTMAREKFRYCFKRLVPTSSNRKSLIQTKLLAEIMDELRKLDEKTVILVEKVELIKHGVFTHMQQLQLHQISTARNSMISNNSIPSQQQINLHQQNSSMISRPISSSSSSASDATGLQRPVILKPTILAECRYYLQEYGNTCDFIKFNVENHLWDELIKTLVDNVQCAKIDQLFLTEVVPYVNSKGFMSQLLDAFKRLDDLSQNSALYIQSLYGFCARNRRFNSLYYIQSMMEDHLAAGNTQLRYFFLIKPIENYRELNQRLASLRRALKDYRRYLEIHRDSSEQLDPSTLDGATNVLGQQQRMPQNDTFHLHMSVTEVERKIYTIERQIEITVNFSLNEVSGIILPDFWDSGPKISFSGTSTPASPATPATPSPIATPELTDELVASFVAMPPLSNTQDFNNRQFNQQMSSDSFSPVTLFDQSVMRKTYLAGLVLIYYDLSCGSCFSQDGLQLANELISVYSLDKLNVYKVSMRILLEEEGCDIIGNAKLLLECIRNDIKSRTNKSSSTSSRTNNDDNKDNSSYPAEEATRAICDDVLRDSIASCREPDYKMELAKLLSNEAKIELYIEIGKLSNAQMLACNLNRPDYVSSIIEKASELNQNHVKTVCQLWLAKHETKMAPKASNSTRTMQMQSVQQQHQQPTTSHIPTNARIHKTIRRTTSYAQL